MSNALIAGRYQLGQELARINHSVFYEGLDTAADAGVLIRLIDLHQEGNAELQAKVQRFRETEDRVLPLLDHPGILRAFESGVYGQTYYLIQEFFPFETLAMLLVQKTRLDAAEVLPYAIELAETLAYLHGEGIVHCDVKPQNILLAPGNTRLMEFCIANHTVPQGTLTGTPPYMSPEAIQGAPPAPPRDVWALGVTLYELLTGQPPFRAPDHLQGPEAMRALLETITSQPVPPIVATSTTDTRNLDRAVPPRLRSFILAMLDKDPARRPAPMEEIVSTLRDIHVDLIRDDSEASPV